MNRKDFVIDLAKLMIAAAWADGELAAAEINAMKDLMFSLEDVSDDEWRRLDLYIDSPVSENETEELLRRVLEHVRSHKDKSLVLESLRHLFECDGEVAKEEQALLDEIGAALSAHGTGLLTSLAKSIRAAIHKHQEVPESASRESRMEDYLKNPVYYQLRLEQEKPAEAFDRPEQELRKVSFAAGLLAHAANADSEISDAEREAMRNILADQWRLSPQEADMLTNIACQRAAKGMDFYRMTHGFFDVASLRERKDLLKALFQVANACGKTANNEIEEIRRIARGIKLSHTEFIEAKLTISREDRGGL